MERYEAMFNRDRPVIRVVPAEFDTILSHIGYSSDDETDETDIQTLARERKEEDDLVAYECDHIQKRRLRTEKLTAKRKRMRGHKDVDSAKDDPLSNDQAIPEESTCAVSVAVLSSDDQPMDFSTVTTRIVTANTDALPAVIIERARSRRVPDSHARATEFVEFSAAVRTAHIFPADFSLPMFTSPSFPTFSYIASDYRRVRLRRAIRRCIGVRICTSAVTGRLNADESTRLCLTCNSNSDRRVEVCESCIRAGCHHNHAIAAPTADRTTDSVLQYCDCAVNGHSDCRAMPAFVKRTVQSVTAVDTFHNADNDVAAQSNGEPSDNGRVVAARPDISEDNEQGIPNASTATPPAASIREYISVSASLTALMKPLKSENSDQVKNNKTWTKTSSGKWIQTSDDKNIAQRNDDDDALNIDDFFLPLTNQSDSFYHDESGESDDKSARV